MATFYAVAVYDTDSHYGGPEEGGWWYTDGPLVTVTAVGFDKEAMNELCRETNAMFAEARENTRTDIATVIEVPRKVSVYQNEKCHMDIPAEEDRFETRWDIPTEYRDGYRPHYC